MQFVYSDGLRLVLDDGQPISRESDYLTNYIAQTQRMNDAKQWKSSGYGASFRGETQDRHPERVEAFVNSLAVLDEKTVLYSFTVNEMSGLYKKDFTREKDGEAHVVHSNNTEFLGLDYNERTDTAVCTVKTDSVCANLALVDMKTNDYRVVTGGDSKDYNPSFSRAKANTVLFDSCGVGRDYNGTFVRYAPAAVASLNTLTMEITEIKSSDKYSYVCPKDDEQGNLYCIRRPVAEKKKRNLFIDILLIPWRLLQAIYYFLESFVLLFTGKTFTEKNQNPTKGRERNSQQILIDGNKIEADKEFKRNQRNKDKLAGFIPYSWQLIKLTDGGDEIIKKGIAAFDVCPDGALVCTNGKHVFRIADGKTEKIASGTAILKVAAGGKTHPVCSLDGIFDL